MIRQVHAAEVDNDKPSIADVARVIDEAGDMSGEGVVVYLWGVRFGGEGAHIAAVPGEEHGVGEVSVDGGQFQRDIAPAQRDILRS